jgi:hypothetical protein
VRVLSETDAMWIISSIRMRDSSAATLSVAATLTSQIGCNGVVPSRQYFAGFESER